MLQAMAVRTLRRTLAGAELPQHIGVVMDGNRRWAREQGMPDPNVGHRHGARHVADLLNWCRALGIWHVTVYVASIDNLRKRDPAEIDHLMTVLEEVVAHELVRPGNPWRLHLAGHLDALPDHTAHALKLARDATHERVTCHVTIAVGYDGRVEIVDAIRSLLVAEAGADPVELAGRITEADIAAHLPSAAQPPCDLVIRTSGEQRLSGFLLWQSAHSELFFCDAYWPAFRELDLLRILRTYAARAARRGRS
jgi:short-chain Z-isoprenyl diphosphate synthase